MQRSAGVVCGPVAGPDPLPAAPYLSTSPGPLQYAPSPTPIHLFGAVATQNYQQEEAQQHQKLSILIKDAAYLRVRAGGAGCEPWVARLGLHLLLAPHRASHAALRGHRLCDSTSAVM